MPLFRGGSLQFHLKEKGKFPIESVKIYAVEILCGLEELRKWHIVYRDLKPDNLLFDDDGHIVLTDFGLCGKLRKKNNYKLQGKAGTPTFMAPEMLKKEPYDYSV